MPNQIDPQRLKQLRLLAGLGQAELAQKAGIDKQTLYRLERGKPHRTRQRTLEALCRVLKSDPETLTGDKPMPPGRRQEAPQSDSSHQINVRLDGALRNSYSLVALRYKIPVKRIAELAPFLLVLAAEASLKWRREKLSNFAETLGQLHDLHRENPHLPNGDGGSYYFDDVEHAERRSIDENDIFGKDRFDELSGSRLYDYSADNPFATYLQRQVKSLGIDAQFEDVSATLSASFEVCRNLAEELAGNDKRLANGILSGSALLNEIPRELLKQDAQTERMKWLDQKITEQERLVEMLLEELTRLNPEELSAIETKVTGPGKEESEQ